MTATEELLAFLRRLRAIKEYTPEAIAPEVVSDILNVGRWTGTGGNRQPTDVVVVTDASVKQKFGEWGARPAATANVVLLLVSASDTNAFDEGRMAERLALAAAAHGLGSTIATLKNEGPDEAKKLLGIPEDRRARSVVALGHPDRAARAALAKNPQGGRKPLAEYAHFEKF
ncbi:MAG TPA: nitroreductase family protein [Chloroflexota bacterium]|jgi:nitroreductase